MQLIFSTLLCLLAGPEKDQRHSDPGQTDTEKRSWHGPWPSLAGLHRDGQTYAGTDSGPPATQEVRGPRTLLTCRGAPA